MNGGNEVSNTIGRPVARPATTPEQDTVSVSSSNFAQNYPNLYRLIGISRKNDNFHERGCFTVFLEDGVYKIFINDRPEGRSCAVSHAELGGALAIAEAGLKTGSLKWRLNKQYRAKAKAVYS